MNKYLLIKRFSKNSFEYVYLFHKNIIFLFLIISFIKNFNDTRIGIFSSNSDEDDYFVKYNKSYLKPEIIDKFNSYIKLCRDGKLIDKTKYPLLKTPKISVIIPIYNGGKYLDYSLKTIQNQELKEIEIIIIDDCSTDDSLNDVERLMKEEPRIRLIKNLRNRKILYSKSIAALNSNGEFILELDQDDMFIREDLFSILYLESKKNNLDLVQFRDIIKEDFYFERRTRINFGKLHWIFPKKTFFMNETQLKETLFKDNNNYLLWGLLIRSEIYKKAIYNIWEFIINYQFIYNEDYISTTMIMILAHNYKYLNIFGIVHLKHQDATSFNCISKGEFHLSNIIFPIYLNNYFVKNNPKYVNLIFNYISLNRFYQNQASKIYKRYFDSNIRNLFYNNYLLLNEKEDIINMFNISNPEILSSYSYIMNSSEFYSIFNFQNSIINTSQMNEKHINHTINKKKNLKFEELNKYSFQYLFINDSSPTININKIIKVKSKKNKKRIKKSFSEKISIIIYCDEMKFLEKTLNSIIEQKDFYYFEIIIIFDSAEEMSLSENFNYKNIHIINNFKKKGIMHSFSIGALASKGQFILHMESGYTLAKQNILKTLYNLANQRKLDILEFNLLINKDDNINENSLNIYKCLHFNSSHNTNEIKYNKNYKEFEQEKELLINKLVRSEIYKSIIYKYKLFEYNKIIYNNYDDIIIFLLEQKKYSFQHTNRFGVIKNINDFNSLELNQIANKNEQQINDSIFFINFLFEHSRNRYKEKKLVYDKYVNLLSLINNKFTNNPIESFKLFKKFMKCKYIKEIEKQELLFFYNSLKN